LAARELLPPAPGPSRDDLERLSALRTRRSTRLLVIYVWLAFAAALALVVMASAR
jgi:hypothetical protein